MLEPLRHRVYARLFAAQVVALTGTGLATVALGLLAFDLAGGRAGAVLGTALFIKMVAYVGLAPFAGALAERLPRRALLVGLNLIRAGVALMLPFVESVWQIYSLIFLLQAAAAFYTPAFQAVIPEILTDEAEYTRALSLSRMAYDLESLGSPALAAAALLVLPSGGLFAGTALGFVAAAALVASVRLPEIAQTGAPFLARAARGMRLYLATPRLRGLLALNLAAAAGGAMVFVNTVVLVQERLGLGDARVAATHAAFGAGSMAAALALPRLLARISDRAAMLSGAAALAAGLGALGLWLAAAGGWAALLVLWAALGAAYATVVTPAGRVLARSARREDLSAVFAAQFSLSHACWLLAYPLAGFAGADLGLGQATAALAVLAVAGLALAARAWPANDAEVLEHVHPDLPPGHPHIADGRRHAHRYVIDDVHARWP